MILALSLIQHVDFWRFRNVGIFVWFPACYVVAIYGNPNGMESLGYLGGHLRKRCMSQISFRHLAVH